MVLGDGGDDEAVAALLHDVVEDTDATVDDVRAGFGDRVADVVEACTDAQARPKPPWEERKAAYLEHLRSDDVDVGALRVSTADKLDNVRADACRTPCRG
ncbi:MAG: HD domain-containing protein [Acidimicrobiia bacterium]|nr:HD domain-containing protein [Acidimicrobiia bacterium]